MEDNLKRNIKLVKKYIEQFGASQLYEPRWNESHDMLTMMYVSETTGYIPVLVGEHYVPLLQLEFTAVDDGISAELSPLLPSSVVPEGVRAMPHLAMALINKKDPKFEPVSMCRIAVPVECVPKVEHAINYVNSRTIKCVMRMYKRTDVTCGFYMLTENLKDEDVMANMSGFIESCLDNMYAYLGPMLDKILRGDFGGNWDADVFDAQGDEPIARRVLKRMIKNPTLHASVLQHMKYLLEDSTMSAEDFDNEVGELVSTIIAIERKKRRGHVLDGNVSHDMADADRLLAKAVEQLNKDDDDESPKDRAEGKDAADTADTTTMDASTSIRMTVEGDADESDIGKSN